MTPFRIPAIDPTFRLDLKQAIEAMPVSLALRIAVIGFSAHGVSVLEMPIRIEITFDGTTVQGGLVGVLADYAGVSAAASTLPEGWTASTAAFEVHNLRPARGDKLVAVGSAVRVGKTTAVSRAEVYACSGSDISGAELVCIATTTSRPSRMPVR